MSIASRGASMAVDWEQRVDFARLRKHRLSSAPRRRSGSRSWDPCCSSTPTTSATSRARRSGPGSATKTSGSPSSSAVAIPILWDFGSAARHHQLYCPWLPESSWRAWVPPMRGAMPDRTGMPDALADMVFDELRERGLEKEPVGIDVPDMTTLLALQRKGIHVADSQPVMMEARRLKTEDELALLDHAAAIVDAAYEEIYRMLRPGVSENQVVAAAMKVLFELGSEHVEAINAISGDRCIPAPAHVRRPPAAPGGPGLLRHHPLLHGLPDVLLPDVQRRLRDAGAARRVQAVPRVAGRGDRARAARRDDRQDRRGLADGAGPRA